MTEPKTKAALLARNEEERSALLAFVGGLTPDALIAPGTLGTWSVKDTVAHLSAWERLFIGWYEAGVHGDAVHVPAEGYSWPEMDRLNDDIFRAWHDATWEDVRARWDETSTAICDVIEAASEEELFKSGRYAWTGRSSLAGYAWPCSGEHYAWARAELERGLAARD